MKIDFNTLEEYYKTLQYLEYEYTNNLIYEFFKRTLEHSDKIDNYEYKPPISYTLTLKDVILFENSEIRFTLQDIIYNSCNEFYEEYGFKDAFNLTADWFAPSYLAIDQGPIIVMIENYRTGLIWKLFMSHPDVQKGLKKLGFKTPYLN